MYHPGWYIPHTLCWFCVCCAIIIFGLYMWWVPCSILFVRSFGKTWAQDMGYYPILWWGCPSWDCMIHTQHSLTILLSSSIRGIVTRFYLLHLPKCFYILFNLCMCGAFTVSLIVTFFYTILADDAIKVYSEFLFIFFCLTFIIPSFPLCANIRWLLTTWDWNILLWL